ncbi:MAG: AmmeMemoRadiSam system protein B [Gammaproteobacteria bacterium]|nr:AmmeMemoRadiSam system protein B [Gammaproteobacteria bacterium]
MPSSRPAAVAGTFYPAEPSQLARVVEGMLAQAREALGTGNSDAPPPKAFIVPHAGYRFSGRVAAGAYARLQSAAGTIRRVVLVGPSHRVGVPGIAIPSVEAFDTPLGSVTLDQANMDLLRALPFCAVADEPHAQEHSLEVQLPFLQKLLPDFRLTAVAVGRASTRELADALACVWGGPETVVLISSDLSHYHTYHEGQRRDVQSSRAIVSLAQDRLRSVDACGWRGVNGLLRQAAALGLIPTTLELVNSGDTTGRRDRVVGYGAWAFAPDPAPVARDLDEGDGQKLLEVAAAGVRNAVAGKPVPQVLVSTFSKALRQPGASFVTLTKGGRLRGCLGSLQAFRPLVLDVAERSHSTAVNDPRFPSVEPAELPALHLEVAALTAPAALSFASADELMAQLQPGVDGLIIEDQGRRATFLPKVWEEIREPPRFFARLLQKAGLPADHWSSGLRAWRYQTRRFGAPLVTGRPSISSPRELD